MKKINEGFICVSCEYNVPPANKTCRNHCPRCFTSLHVDGKIPGDRDTTCRGIMKPIETKTSGNQTKIHFICTTCRKTHRNKLADDDQIDKLIDVLNETQETLLYL